MLQNASRKLSVECTELYNYHDDVKQKPLNSHFLICRFSTIDRQQTIINPSGVKNFKVQRPHPVQGIIEKNSRRLSISGLIHFGW